MYSLPQSYNQTSKCKRCICPNAYCAEIFVTVARGVLLEELVRITSYSEGLEIVSSAVGADSMTSGLAWFESLIVGASGTETVSL